MLHSPMLIPLLHGTAGVLDELLLMCAPLLVVVMILAIASRRARQKAAPRERVRPESDSPDDTAATKP